MNSTISRSARRATRSISFCEIESKDTSEARYLCRAHRPQDEFAVFLPREKKHRYYIDHREGLFYIRTNKSGINFAIMTAPENDPAPQELEGLRPAPRRRPHRATSICSRTSPSPWKSREALDHLRVHDFKTGTWTDIAFPGARLFGLSRRHARIRIHHLPLQLPELDHAVQRLRLRRRSRQIHAAEAAGSARRVRPETIRHRAPVGHRARRRQGAASRSSTRRASRATARRRCSSTATAPTESARRPRFPATA